MLLWWKLNVAHLLLVVSQLWCTLLSCLAFIFFLVLALIFLLFLVLSSQECELKGYQPTYFMMKNEKNWGGFFREAREEGKVLWSSSFCGKVLFWRQLMEFLVFLCPCWTAQGTGSLHVLYWTAKQVLYWWGQWSLEQREVAKRVGSERSCTGLVLCVKYVEWQEKICLV